MHTVPGSSARPLPVLLIALLMLCLLAGCGKSAGGVSSALQANGNSTASGTPTTLLGSAGAGGLSTPNTTRLGGSSPMQDAAAVARAVYPGLTLSGRPQAVVIVNADDWPAALAASALAAAPLQAPILYGEDGHLPAVSEEALRAMKPLGSRALGGAQVIAVGTTPPAGYKALTITAVSPYAVAASIAGLLTRLQGGHVGAAILASTTAPAALSMPAAGLAAESGAPILLLGSKGIPRATRAALSRLGNPPSYAIGPAAAISEETFDELRRSGDATRIGADGYSANAIKVAAFTDGHFGWGVDEPGHGFLFALASRPLDAPASALLSATGDFAPLLLLGEGPEGISTDLERYLRDIQPAYGHSPESLPVHGVYNRGWLIGDQQAISVRAQSQLDALLRSVPGSNASQPSLVP